MQVIKRNGTKVEYNRERIIKAINGANRETIDDILTTEEIENIVNTIESKITDMPEISVESIQDLVEEELMKNQHFEIAKKYITYRYNHMLRRNISDSLLNIYQEILFTDAKKVDGKRENANINTNAPMGIMLKLGTEGSKHFLSSMLPEEFNSVHKEGWVHFHDLDFSLITFNCCQIDLLKLLKGGFSNGNGYIREPQSIRAYSALACIAIQSNQNSMLGGQSINAWDFAMADGIQKSFYKAILNKTYEGYVTVFRDMIDRKSFIERFKTQLPYNYIRYLDAHDDYLTKTEYIQRLKDACDRCELWFSIDNIRTIYNLACRDVEEETKQAMESAIHNFCTLRSRAGSQTPFSSINFGLDTSPEGRLAIRETLNAIDAGLGHGETAFFPIAIFGLKSGINYNPEDKNYDLFKLACKVSAKRMFPNFTNNDAPYNLQYYIPNDYNTFAVAMGCRTRVIANVNGPNRTGGRGNFAFTTLNLPAYALSVKDKENKIEEFFKILDHYIDISHDYLLYRYQIIADKHVYNFPFLMDQGVWYESEKLKPKDTIRSVLKHSTLSIGFVGLAECLLVLLGKHHGESKEAQKLGLKIVSHIRKRTDDYTEAEHMNWSTFATPSESCGGRMQKLNKKRFGEILNITSHKYLTNSFHIPVYYKIRVSDKINIEAPYHELCNAGSISYIEIDGDPLQNLEAFETIVRAMHDADMNYFAINHPVDTDPVCGYTGIIKNECPHCHRKEKSEKHHISVKRK